MASAKYALVTGGNRGIGLEVCKALVAKGKPVLFTARNAAQGNARLSQCGCAKALTTMPTERHAFVPSMRVCEVFYEAI